MRILIWVLTATAVFAGWEDVQRVARDGKIEVVQRQGETARGAFVSASETAVVVRTKSGEETIARGDIKRVKVYDGSRRARNALIGGAIGAGVGFALGVAICPGCANEGNGGKYTGPMAAAGAGAGAAAGLLPAPYRTLYKAK